MEEFMLPGKNGYDISCLEWPCAEARAVLLCLHGFAGDKSSSVIRALAEALAGRSLRVFAFDWPGHGGSPADGAFLTVENCLSDLDTVIRYLQAGSPTIDLFATSFGGYLGVHYLLRHPGVFSKVVLRSPALHMPDTYRSLLSGEERRVLEHGGTVDKGFERPLRLGRSFGEDLCRHRIPEEGLPAMPPGLILQGDLDDVVDPRDSAAFAEKYGLHLHVVKGADHRYKKPGNLEEILSAAVPFLLE